MCTDIAAVGRFPSESPIAHIALRNYNSGIISEVEERAERENPLIDLILFRVDFIREVEERSEG